MSWLNSSLSSLKGQLTNLAQEVLAETAGPGDDGYRGPEVNTKTALQLLAETQQQKEELDKQCEHKDREIAALRKQISKLQHEKINDSGGGGVGVAVDEPTKTRANKSADDNEQQGNVDDSWCWEPETDNATKSEAAVGGLVDVSLTSEGNAQVQLQARIHDLEAENKQLNTTLEQLDTQHTVEIQDVLQLKNELQAKHNELLQAHETLKEQHTERLVSSELALAKLGQECEELRNALGAVTGEKTNLQQRLDGYAAELKQNIEELADLQALLEKKSQDNGELIERIKALSAANEQNASERTNELQQRVEQLTKELEELKKPKEKKTSESSSNSSSTGSKQSEDEFIVVREADANSSGPTTPPTKEELRDKLVQLESRVAELTLENGNLILKLQDQKLERELSMNVLNEAVEALELRHATEAKQLDEKTAQLALAVENVREFSEQLKDGSKREEQLMEELQTLRTKLEGKMQKLTLENQELKLNAEAEQESFNNSAELENKLKALAEENETLRNELEASIAQAKFRQAIAEEKQEITDLDADATGAEASLDMSELRELLGAFVNQNMSETPAVVLEKSYKAIRQRLNKIESLEKSIRHMSKEIADLQEHKLRWDHEKKTLEADILQYVVQCEDLMKNNEILLNDLENIRHKKLETIHENNEETVVLLEAQVEECTQLNSTLEQEYSTLGQRHAELEYEQHALSEQLTDALKEKLTWQQRCETLERERNSWQEAKATSEQNEIVAQLQEKCESLMEQLTRMSKDHAELVGAMETQQTTLLESNKKRETLELELIALGEQLAEAEATKAQQTQLETTQLAELRQELNAKDIVNENLKQQLSEQQQQLTAMRTELAANATTAAEAVANLSAEQKKSAASYEELQARYEQQAKTLATLEAAQTSETRIAAVAAEATARIAQLEAELLATADFPTTIETLKSELNAVTTALHQKHAENQRYYAEMQRLEQQMLAQTTAQTQKACENCVKLDANIAELQSEREKLQDQINFLKEKSDILTTNLLTEQTNQKLVAQEKADVIEQNNVIRKDLERLREHLLEVEELHTQETVELQHELDETKSKMLTLQEDVAKSSTAYTSASIRANQHAETLQAQYALVVQQRDELLTKLSWSEDRDSKNQAALVNLQCALEQFQNDKEQDIKSATQRIRKELQLELDKETALQSELAMYQQQLADANQGLRAAARLSDQLESCQQTIAVLRDEIDNLKEYNGKLELQLNTSESSQTDKIEKNLIKSLLIGYVVSGSAGDKQQVLRMIAAVLDFTAQESDKVGLNKQQSSWLGAILGGGGANGAGSQGKDNLVQAFVQFLEQESQPQKPPLPTLISATAHGENSSTGGDSRRTSTVAVPTPLQVSTAATTPMTVTSTPAVVSALNMYTAVAPTAVPAPIPIQTLHLGSSEFAPTRNSSSILKDILSDS